MPAAASPPTRLRSPRSAATWRRLRVDVDFSPTAKERELRDEVRSFLDETLPAHPCRPTEDSWMVGFSREFSRALGARGWIGYTWPKRYGGGEGTYLERLIITEELLRAGAPVAAHWTAD